MTTENLKQAINQIFTSEPVTPEIPSGGVEELLKPAFIREYFTFLIQTIMQVFSFPELPDIVDPTEWKDDDTITKELLNRIETKMNNILAPLTGLITALATEYSSAVIQYLVGIYGTPSSSVTNITHDYFDYHPIPVIEGKSLSDLLSTTEESPLFLNFEGFGYSLVQNNLNFLEFTNSQELSISTGDSVTLRCSDFIDKQLSLENEKFFAFFFVGNDNYFCRLAKTENNSWTGNVHENLYSGNYIIPSSYRRSGTLTLIQNLEITFTLTEPELNADWSSSGLLSNIYLMSTSENGIKFLDYTPDYTTVYKNINGINTIVADSPTSPEINYSKNLVSFTKISVTNE